jgi:hypothetical protein
MSPSSPKEKFSQGDGSTFEIVGGGPWGRAVSVCRGELEMELVLVVVVEEDVLL